MSDDIVKRLREQKVTVAIYGPTNSETKVKDPTELELEAADEIEKLRKSLRDMTTRYSEGIGERNKLRAALKPFALAAEDLDDGETGAIWERPCAMNITCDDLRNCQGIFDGSTIEQSSTVRAAKAALGENDD